MKLLEDVPSAVTQRPPRRRAWVTLTMTAVLLVLAGVGGLAAVLASGDTGDTSVSRAEWTDTATQVCSDVATEHPIMTQGAAERTKPVNVADVAAGTQALASGIEEAPAPDDDAAVRAVVTSGERARQQWTSLVNGGTEVTGPNLTQASELTAAVVDRLTGLGADCAALR